ncbi:cytochrome P450 [Aspergillus venezuelensis]
MAGPTVVALIATVFLTVLVRVSKIGSRGPSYPTGPPMVPLLGNVHLLPKSDFTAIFPQWVAKYGKVFSLKICPATMVVLCDRKAIHKILVEKGSLTSDRPPNYREMDEKHMKTQAAEGAVLMMSFLQDPEAFQNEIRRYAISVINSITWGYRASDTESFAYKVTSDLLDTRFPFIAWVPSPLAAWKRRAIRVRSLMDDTWGSFQNRVDSRRANGERRSCIIDGLLDEYDNKGWPEGLTHHALNNLINEIVEGGSDTTASILMTTVQLIAVNPEVQTKARRELDRVCGAGRSPDWSDFAQLPYVNCIVK